MREYIHEKTLQEERVTFLKEWRMQVKRFLKEDIDRTLDMLQKKYKADALQIGEYIYKFHPNIWKEVYKDWDEVFSEMEIDVDVKVYIRGKGLVE